MEIKAYNNQHFNDIFNVIHKTIEEIYPKYYPKEAVDFFHNHHSKENMEKQLPDEYTLVIFENDVITGTGTLIVNEIKPDSIINNLAELINEIEKIDNK